MTSAGTPRFHNTIYLHGPHDPAVTWVERAGPGDGFASIQTSGASLLVSTVAEADALIKAAVAAKDLLLGAQDPQPAYCSARDQSFRCGKALGHHAGHAAYVHGIAVHRWPAEPAPLPPAHGPNHIDNAGHATLCAGECLPGTCVICGGHYEPDGSHISATSGAHIPAEPQQVST